MSRTLLVTGASRGLGYETALALLRDHPDMHLVVAVRSEPAALAARLGDARVHGVRCDLASMASVRTAAAEIAGLLDAGELPPLHGIIGNAGIQTTTATQATPDGFETTFATNVLGHYLLIRLLLDHLAEPARIVLVGSGTHFGDFRHTMGLVPAPRTAPVAELARPWTTPDATTTAAGRSAYAASKLATVHLVHELDRRTPDGVSVYCFDPGLMPGTGLVRQGTALERAAWNSVFHLTRLLPGVTSPRASGRKLARSAAGPTAPARSGAYLEFGRPKPSSADSYDPAREAELWKEAAELVGPL